MGYAGHSEAPKSIIDALSKKSTTSVNYMQVIPNSHYWTDLNQIITANNFGMEELTKEYILVGLNNCKKNGYRLKSLFNEDIRFIQGSIPIFSSIEQMINYVESEHFDKGLFLEAVQKTVEAGINLTNGKKMERPEVYKCIDGERNYQDMRWNTNLRKGDVPDEEKPVAEWINYIEYHLGKAKAENYHLNKEGTLAELRKVAALTVRAMEIHGCPERKIE